MINEHFINVVIKIDFYDKSFAPTITELHSYTSFLIFLNDLPSLLKVSKALYADDNRKV